MSGPKRGRIVERPIVRARRELRDTHREASRALKTAQSRLASLRAAHAEVLAKHREIEHGLEQGDLDAAQRDAAWRIVTKAQKRLSAADVAITAFDGGIARLVDAVGSLPAESDSGQSPEKLFQLCSQVRRQLDAMREAGTKADQLRRAIASALEDADRHLNAAAPPSPASAGGASVPIAVASRLLAQLEQRPAGVPPAAITDARRALQQLTSRTPGPSCEQEATELCDTLATLQQLARDAAAAADAAQEEARATIQALRSEIAATRTDVCRWAGSPEQIAEVAALVDASATLSGDPSASLPEAARTAAARWNEIRRVAEQNKERHARRDQIANAIAESLTERVYDEPVGRYEREKDGVEDPLSNLIVYAAHPSGKGDIRVHLGVDGNVTVEVEGVPQGEEEICRDLLAGIGEATQREELEFDVTDWGRASSPSPIADSARESAPRERQHREREERPREQ
jgi:hypothetical protein